ncbi:HdeD family acid-resistance protein [Planctomicrobium sp. SH661]|uniref:HdeD family acid-resistance protein n=1 Tax=Planctomicrobium sp. SH661 TaxID=3448124 RepID=UPI003F5B8079
MSNAMMKFPTDLAPLKKEWGWLMGLGVGLVVLGTLAISMPLIATIEVIEVLGILMAMAGFAQIIGAFHAAQWRGFVVQIALGILYLVTSFLVLVNPVEGAAGLTLVMAAFFLTGGLFRIVIAMSERFPGWGWVLLNGFVTMLMGLIIWRQFPVSALWVIGLLVGIELLFCGWAWIMLAIAAKTYVERTDVA